MNECPVCRTKNIAGSNYCSNCGYNLREQEVSSRQLKKLDIPEENKIINTILNLLQEKITKDTLIKQSKLDAIDVELALRELIDEKKIKKLGDEYEIADKTQTVRESVSSKVTQESFGKRPVILTIAVILLTVWGIIGIIAGIPVIFLGILNLVLGITLQFLIIETIANLLYSTFNVVTAIVEISTGYGIFKRRKWAYKACMISGVLLIIQSILLIIGYKTYFEPLIFCLLAILFLYLLYQPSVKNYFTELHGFSVLHIDLLNTIIFFMKYYIAINLIVFGTVIIYILRGNP